MKKLLLVLTMVGMMTVGAGCGKNVTVEVEPTPGEEITVKDVVKVKNFLDDIPNANKMFSKGDICLSKDKGNYVCTIDGCIESEYDAFINAIIDAGYSDIREQQKNDMNKTIIAVDESGEHCLIAIYEYPMTFYEGTEDEEVTEPYAAIRVTDQIDDIIDNEEEEE